MGNRLPRMLYVCGGLLLGLWLAAVPGWAGFEEGWRAYQSGEYATALREWLPLAQQGDAGAQNNLGRMYDFGQGVPQDYSQAMQWYRRAAEQGADAAQYNLGLMYREGQGIPQDYVQAAQWFRRAAEQGYAKAQNNLGVMYEHGRGVPQDSIQAHLWYNLAAASFPPGSDRERAVRNRDGIAAHMPPAQLAQAQALARTWQPKPETAPPQQPQPAVLPDDAPTRIRRAQERLTALGFAPGPVDGVPGPRLRTALQQFQRSQRLPVTGVLNDATWRALGDR